MKGQMNIIEAIRIVGIVMPDDDTSGRYREAYELIGNIVAQYDALAPTPEMWSQYPWARWCTIDANGWRYFHDGEPMLNRDRRTMFLLSGKRSDFYEDVVLPLGLDWRVCKWQRPKYERKSWKKN